MIVTSDEGTSYCPQCEAYAKQIEELKKEAAECCKGPGSRLEKLERVAEAARKVRFTNSSTATKRELFDNDMALFNALSDLDKTDSE